MKKLLFTITCSVFGLVGALALNNDIALNNFNVQSIEYIATSTATSTVTATSTATSSWNVNEEVNNNYSEIVDLKDCKLLTKRVKDRISKINDKLDKQSKNVDTLVYQLNNILASTSLATNSDEDSDIDMRVVLKDKMYMLSTSTFKYVRGLKAIETTKCESNQKLVKAQILNTKTSYRDVLQADYDLRNYIRSDVKEALLKLRDDISAESEQAATLEKESAKTTIKDSGSIWDGVRGLFK